MALSIGGRLGAYEIIGLIGAGGMGEVYRARDTRLKRDVAIKVLPESLSHDPDRLARFQREAELLATLNHSNIAAIYGLEEADGHKAIVLELVEGETLADLIARGPVPMDDALPIAKQIAEALEAAHERGVIHRDLKPANIKLAPDGHVKVLDFGLAKLLETSPAATGGLSMSPTLSMHATYAGVILGTAAYMSPEQARGKPVDRRTDIWAFGCVLFEMLTGKRAFDGADATEMIAAVVRAEADWAALPAETPPRLRALLKRCLEKDPKQRLRDIGDARFELDEVLRRPTHRPDEGPNVTMRAPLWRRALVASTAGLALTALGAYIGWTLRPEPGRTITRFTISLPDGQRFTGTNRHTVAISPAGTHIAFTAGGRLNVRALDQLETASIRATENATNPFFSPDGRWIGFYQSGQLKKVSIDGGAALTICAALNPWGASWGADDTILFGQGPNGIMRVPAAGGTPDVLIKVDPTQAAHGPQMLPGGRAVLFTLRPQDKSSWDDAQIVVQSLDTGERKVLVDGGTDARYLPTGHLVYAAQGTLLAVPFDATALSMVGGPVPLVEDIARTDTGQTGAAQFSISTDGALVYVSGFGVFERRDLVWVDRSGKELPVKAAPDAYRYPRISPDGTRLLLDLRGDIWIWHFTAETLTRLTLDPALEQYAAWATDGRVIFGSARNGASWNLYSQAADGTGEVERLTQSEKSQFPLSVSPDGAQLVFQENGILQAASPTNIDLKLLPLRGERRPQALVQTAFNEINGEISPDGHWLAYESNESGRFEVYVRPFPNVNGGRWQISTEGGTRALWARDGRELLYITPSGDALMRVEVSGQPSFKTGTPSKLLDTRAYYFTPTTTGFLGSPGRMYDASSDGLRFLMLKPSADAAQQTPAPPSITVVQNWTEELKKRVPVN